MIASLLSEDIYSMFCLSAAMRVLLPENAMPIFIIDVTFMLTDMLCSMLAMH